MERWKTSKSSTIRRGPSSRSVRSAAASWPSWRSSARRLPRPRVGLRGRRSTITSTPSKAHGLVRVAEEVQWEASPSGGWWRAPPPTSRRPPWGRSPPTRSGTPIASQRATSSPWPPASCARWDFFRRSKELGSASHLVPRHRDQFRSAAERAAFTRPGRRRYPPRRALPRREGAGGKGVPRGRGGPSAAARRRAREAFLSGRKERCGGVSAGLDNKTCQ